ncbi:SGNH/GDSL hydrolase family protein [Desulfatitalea alkaliphila]|uniref:SGNH/GDSL hydrolase family protein n=1 Tax=Desulfatitalea alkaliphila TaxID=2929485 RepID=A0AA41R3Y2_9BACT|nr:SGNH/GDSL hydrolase family protein [Desulfatitalea alkaliphila]MCJ8501186.1 SGNH/GDSL hydrolase family protein [Desulfatitalea alkaliphila]
MKMKKGWKVWLGLSLSACLVWAMVACVPSGGNVNSQVVIIGDSIFALSGEIHNELERLSGERYRDYAVSGAQLDGGSFVTPIPDQYARAVRADGNIRTVIMDGGGNDVQVGARMSCSGGTVSAACRRELAPSLEAADALFAKMRRDGVENIVYMNYFFILDTSMRPAFLYMHDEMEKLVQKHGGVLVEPMPIFNANPQYIGPDRIHPTDQGSRVLANLIWDTLQAHCIEQGPGCVPDVDNGNNGNDPDPGPIGCN